MVYLDFLSERLTCLPTYLSTHPPSWAIFLLLPPTPPADRGLCSSSAQPWTWPCLSATATTLWTASAASWRPFSGVTKRLIPRLSTSRVSSPAATTAPNRGSAATWRPSWRSAPSAPTTPTPLPPSPLPPRLLGCPRLRLPLHRLLLPPTRACWHQQGLPGGRKHGGWPLVRAGRHHWSPRAQSMPPTPLPVHWRTDGRHLVSGRRGAGSGPAPRPRPPSLRRTDTSLLGAVPPTGSPRRRRHPPSTLHRQKGKRRGRGDGAQRTACSPTTWTSAPLTPPHCWTGMWATLPWWWRGCP